MQRFAIYALFVAVTAAGAVKASAQTVPEDQSCGGLLCDMGVFGHKKSPAAPAQTPAAPAPVAAAPPADVGKAKAAEASPDPVKRTVRKKRVVKAPPKPKPTVIARQPEPEAAEVRPQTAAPVVRTAVPPKAVPAAPKVAVETAAPAAPAARPVAAPGSGGTAAPAAPAARPMLFRPIYNF